MSKRREAGEVACAVGLMAVVGTVMGPATMLSGVAIFVPLAAAMKLVDVVRKRREKGDA